MPDPSYYLRAGEAGPLLEGTAGNVLTFQADGTLRGEPAATPDDRTGFVLTAANATNIFQTNAAVLWSIAFGAAYNYSGSADFLRTDDVCTCQRAAPSTYDVELIATLSVAAAVATLGLGIAINDDLIGAAFADPIDFNSGAQYAYQVDASRQVCLVTKRRVSLSLGDTIRAAGITDVLLDTTIQRLRMVVTPVK